MASSTLSRKIANTLSEEILKGDLMPGDRLDEQSLADRFEVSRSPIRDALRELASTRLIEHQPRRGFAVAMIDTTTLRNLYEALGELEGLCARYCALRADAVQREHIRMLHAQGLEAIRLHDMTAYAEANHALHRAIYDACHNDALRDITLDVRNRLSMFHARFLFSEGRVAQSRDEHQEVVDCILRNDGDGASEAMKKHVAKTALNIISHIMPDNRKPMAPAASDDG
ncbi:GntR family transcriptional regulator [Nitratireductor soli]|uniref:GntR family transcriptional regulator n=1 Tax=Nitratireductor soli TaxID=1670619 RepID=UPI00065DD4CB|nr:GntR family transcriptional regulator [Nitratireductor soli]